MAEQISSVDSMDSFEYMLLEKDPDHYKSVFSGPDQTRPWISPEALKLTHRIGRGPFGDVWIATHHNRTEDSNQYREVAVKMLYPIKDDYLQTLLSRFDEVFRSCEGAKHVCSLHGFSIHKGRVCIAMEFYEGSIGDKIVRYKGGKLPFSDVVRYSSDLAHGLLELHAKGILILNLKPCNFLLDANDRAIIGDFGLPSLLLGLPLPSSELVQRLGTPNYMAPEQWEPSIRGPISYETDSWGFGCSIVEMLSGTQPWRGKSPEEIYQLVVLKREKPVVPDGLPLELKKVLFGCFEYDLRDRPSITDVLNTLLSFMPTDLASSSWDNSDTWRGVESSNFQSVDWSALKDKLQVGDAVRSRKQRHSLKAETLVIPEGTIVGVEEDDSHGSSFLVRVLGSHAPLKVRPSTVQRVSFGFSASDWVRVMDEKRSQVGVLHSIDRDGRVAVGLIGAEKPWSGSYTDLQMAEPYYIGQFVKLKSSIMNPRFEWPQRKGGFWATGRISEVLPNGCLVVKFPGQFTLGETVSALADPSEVEAVSFDNCEGLVKKYQHLEDFHWAVRPLFIAFGLFVALKLGVFGGKNARRSSKKVVSVPEQSSKEAEQSTSVEDQDSRISASAKPRLGIWR